MQNFLNEIGLPVATAAERARSVALVAALIVVALMTRALFLALAAEHVFGDASAADLTAALTPAVLTSLAGVAALAALHLRR